MSVSTGGYDIVLQVHEDLINRFLSISHCMGLFRNFRGVYTLPISDVPDRLQEFMDIGYDVSLEGIPRIDFTEDLNLFLNTRGQVKFIVLGGIEFELEVQFRIGVTPTYHQGTSRLSIDFVEAVIEDIELDDVYHLPRNVIDRLNEIMAIAMEEYLTGEVTSIPISPVLFSLNLPHMPPGRDNRLTVGMGSVKTLTSTVFSTALNLLSYTGGDESLIRDITRGAHVGIGISEGAMHRVYDFWWDRTIHPKRVSLNGEHDFDTSGFEDWLELFGEWGLALLTLGLVTEDVELERAWATYGATLRFSKFDFDLRPGNTILFSGSIKADIWLRFFLEIETTTRVLAWEVDRDTEQFRLFDLRVNGLNIDIESAEGRLYLDDDNRLKVEVTDLDITIPLPWEVPEFLLDFIVDWIIDSILNNMPPIMLSPSIVETTIPSTEITIETTIESLEINEQEAMIAANIEPSGLETYAPFVANMDSGEVHLRSCEYGRRIRGENKVWYCDLETAFRHGYDGCYYCLPRHHHH
jgi:hypothetical protein